MGIDVNTVIAGKLRLVSLLGQGSAGQVWLARHLGLGSDVAIKFLNRDVSADATARERFMREARTIAKIRSPHVVQVHDFGFHEEHAYLVMEHLAGETLEARLERMGALPVEQVMRICTQIAKALQKAHDAGIIHRDIKPANVFLVDYGDEEIAKVVDFGIVKATDGSPVSSRMNTLTQTGSVLGTPYYMSPEQIQDSGNVGHQADLWALGVIAYESLVGSLPFTAPNFAQLVIAICQGTIPVPSTIAPVPPAFDAWVARALDRDPSRRFQSAKELARELCQALLSGDDSVSIPDGVIPADLLWSGAYPSATSLAQGRGGSLGDSHGPVITVTSSDDPSAPEGDTIEIRAPEPRASIPGAVVRSAVLPGVAAKLNSSVNQDGSVTPHIAIPHAPKPVGRAAVPRVVLFGVAAAVLVTLGWLAARYETLTTRSTASSSAPSTAAPVDTANQAAASPFPSSASSDTGIAAPSKDSAAASARATAASPTPGEAPIASTGARTRTRPTSSGRDVRPPVASSAEPATPPFPKRVDPLEERQ